MSTGIAIVGPLVLVGAMALVFLGFIFATYRFLRWFWGRLPSQVLSIEAAQLDKALGVLLALALFPSVVVYAWQAVQSLALFLPDFIRTLGLFRFPNNCALENSACISDLAGALATLLSNSATGIVHALNLPMFPVSSFLRFLLAAVVAVQLIGFVHRETAAGRMSDRYASALAYVPAALRQRIAFSMLVVISFYLGLSALLAIPLFQDKTRADQLTPDALSKALSTNILKDDVFNQRFPKIAHTFDQTRPRLKDATVPTEAQSNEQVVVRYALEIFDFALDQRQRQLQTLQGYWDAAQSAALNNPNTLKDQAINAFSAGIEIGGGKKQTAKHYADLIKWHQDATQRQYNALAACGSAVNLFFARTSQSLNNLRTSVETSVPTTPNAVIELYNRYQRDEPDSSFANASLACQAPASNPLDAIPSRPSFADTLGPVGTWTRWLLDTEQMPVVIIVGLVGFSLLGATVSRAVRLGSDRPNAALTLDDLLIVIAGGMTAAIVVFLAAYGGLVLLGNTGGDPNPYVVFVTCLIGAVYSEDVWTWARKSLLKPTAEKPPQLGAGTTDNTKH